jgi:hypothetical protein
VLVRRFNPGLSLKTLLLARRSDLRFAFDALRAGAARVRGIPWQHDESG